MEDVSTVEHPQKMATVRVTATAGNPFIVWATPNLGTLYWNTRGNSPTRLYRLHRCVQTLHATLIAPIQKAAVPGC